ncbi:hypothetical protein GHT06_021170 [Daphnia sinensis]|uniref:C2H2-type domain-containing protein n=1 Tax=Daphnia sinensis TaxID=1820382 RepID=A0AAD5PQL1_9CRUS|nr:hypothetical protein GHT06_021170 [Daphnia sinensis]
MLSSNGNPFLRAEYLNPPPATNSMDSKKSPLALLAQTCSQIGADPTPTTSTKTTSSAATTTSTCNPAGESRKKSASECSPNDKRDPKGSPLTSNVSPAEANNNRLQQQQRPASSDNDAPAARSSPNAASGPSVKAISTKKDVSNNNRLTPTDRRSKSTSPKNRSSATAGQPQPSAMDHPTASTAFMNHLLLHPPQQPLAGGGNSHPSHQHQHQLMMAAALAHGSSDASSSAASASAAAAMSLANSYKSLMAASAAGMAYGGHPSMSPYPHSAYSPHHPSMAAAAAAAAAAAGANTGPYGPPHHPSMLDFGAYANAVAKSTSSAPSGNAFMPTSMMNGYLASQVHPAYSVAALQQAMHQQHYGNAATRLASSSSAAAAAAAGLAQSKPANSNTDPSCRDPYCTGCPASAAGQIHMVCTVGCALSVQCDHIKVPMAAHHLQMLSAPGASSPGSSANGQPPPSSPHLNNNNNNNNSSSSSNNRPYICNWIVGDNYCGKRFASSDDLLQHLRTHTNLSSAAAAAPPPESVSTSSAAFAHPSSMMRAAYPTPPLSPLSAARYHPYGKANPSTTTTTSTSTSSSMPPQQQPGPFPSAPGLFHPGMAAAMAAMAAGSSGPYGAVPAPPSAHLFHMNPALAPYYSHLSLFAHQANTQPSTRHMPGLGPAPLGGAGLGGQP